MIEINCATVTGDSIKVIGTIKSLELKLWTVFVDSKCQKIEEEAGEVGDSFLSVEELSEIKEMIKINRVKIITGLFRKCE